MYSLVYTILFALLLNLAHTECAAGEVELTLSRTTKSWASGEESFKIYEGEGTSGSLKFTQPSISNYATYTWYVCVARVTHTIHMTDSYGDGWTSGSNVVISADGMVLGTYTMAGSSKEEPISFPAIISVDSTTMWQYTNVAQTSNDWTTGTITWDTPASYPDVSTITRYFRYSVDALDETKLTMKIDITTKYGFRVYLNGQTVFSTNVPDTLTSSTEATEVSAEAVERKYSTLANIFPAPIGGKYIFAIELHGTAASQSGAESFSVNILLSNAKSSIIDPNAIITPNPTSGWANGEAPEKLFDGSTGTKWCLTITSADLPVSIIYKLPNNSRQLITKYSVASANDMQTRDCKDWKLYGSNDDATWYELHSVTGEYFGSRQLEKTYDLDNYVSFNSYKWECLDVYNIAAGCFQMSEVGLLLAPADYTAPNMAYDKPAYTWYANVDVVSISTHLAGFTSWNITGGSLPAGLTFNTNDGSITGIPTATLAATTFTVRGVYLVDGQTYSCTVTITVNACSLPTHMPVIATKTNYDDASESWTLKNAAGEVLMSSIYTAASIGACIPTGDYTLTLNSASGTTWYSASRLTIKGTIGSNAVTFVNTRLDVETTHSTTVSFNLPLPTAAASSFKYLNDGTVPTNWNAASFSDAAWTTLNDAERPSTTQNIKLFRATFNVASKTGYQGFEMGMFSRAGIVVFLNGNEIYRRYLAAGAISASTTANGGDVASSWKTVTGSMNSINQGANTIAVGVFTLGTESIQIDFDMYLRLLTDTHESTRYWDFGTTSTTPGAAENLFDGSMSTSMSVSTSTATQKFSITFNNHRAELFNKYCFITSTVADEDPKDWTIEGSNDNGVTFTTLKTETGFTFESRQTSYCFFMPLNTVAYSTYQLTITAARSATAANYKLTAWNLYLQDLNSLVVPELAFTPSEITGYASLALPSSVCSSEYYSSFTITPELPAGLHFSANTGIVTGTVSEPLATTTYTISAMNHLGETKTTTITITIGTCSGDKVSFTLDFHMSTNGAQCSFQLIDQATQAVVAERTSFTSSSILSIPMCESATTYHIKLMKTDSNGWGSSKVVVKLADGTPLLSESLAAGSNSKEYPFNPAYSVYPMWTEWNYLVDGTAAPAGWNTVEGAPASWATAMPYQLPVATGVTQYYYKKFEVASLEGFATIDLSVNVKAGAIVYLNGHEVRRVNMPEGAVDATTAATNENDAAMLIITGEWLNNGKVVVGTNILAVELHRYTENEAKNTFDASAILILDNMFMVIDGIGSSEPEVSGNEGSDKVFDNNASTKMLVSGTCVGVKLYWEYNNERREPIANYGLINANDCNMRHPSGWKLYGSNDGENWKPLQEKNDQFFDNFYQQIRHSFYNTNSYNKYMLEITQCNNPELSISGYTDGYICYSDGSTKFQLADWYLFTQYLAPGTYCNAVDDFPPALNGDISYADCPAMYEGAKLRTCVDGEFGEIVNNCLPLPPAGIQYPQTEYSVYQNKVMEPITPQIVAVEYEVTMFPHAPAGMELNKETGVISGTPTTIQEAKKYTVYVTNIAGREETNLYIAVLEVPINWVLIGVIAAVVVIVIVVVIVVIVSASKKKAASKKKPNVKATKKGTPAPKAVAKPKAAVKV